MPTITLITDFGIKDGNVGVMKGVILGIAPQVQIVDLSHLISPQNVAEGSLILARSAPYFPAGSIHVGVVDPGVGTARRPMAARIGRQYFVGPDNGLLTRWLEQAEGDGLAAQFVQLDQPRYWLEQVSHVFHGRDIFAPVAGWLASGTPLEALGTPFHDPVRLTLPRPQRTATGLRTEIIHIDHFGNLATNLYAHELQGRRISSVSLNGVTIQGLVQTFGERPVGEVIALFGSTGNLIVSVVNGSAAQRLNAAPGQPVEVTLV